MLKKLSKGLIIAAILGLTVFSNKSTVSANPAITQRINAKQPTGQTFTIKMRGDDKFHWTISDTGDVIIKAKNNYWYYAQINNNKLEASSFLYKIDSRPTNAINENELLQWKKSQTPKNSIARTLQQLGIAPQSVTLNQSSRKLLVILVSFANVTNQYSDQAWYNTFFARGTNSVNDYYGYQSKEKFQFTPASESYDTSNPGIVKVTLNYNHPGTNGATDWDENKLLKDVINATGSYVNYAQFDTDGDGYVSTGELDISFIVAGYEESCGGPSPSIWGHMSSLEGIQIQGKTLTSNYCAEAEIQVDHQATIGIFCHELGHTLGLPDLYDYTDASQGVGMSSIMAAGSWGGDGYPGGSRPTNFDAWSKIKLGFDTPTVISANSTYTVNSDGTNYNILKIPTSNPSQYFLVENRELKDYDTSLNQDLKSGGIAIWHVDEEILASNYGVNDNFSRKGVDLEEASQATVGYAHLDRAYDYEVYDDYYHSGSNYQFGDTTTPNSKLYDGTSTNISINCNSAPSTAMNVSINPNGNIPTYAKEDINHDGVVDIKDVSSLAIYYNTKSTSSNWNSTYDMNSDNVIDIFDLVKIARKM